jgi:tRNA(Ile)-lysidine synthase
MITVNQFKTHLYENCGVKDDDRLLVAVSGGADSMALLELLVQCGLDVVVAHCNFHLRNEESDGDEHFVHDYCAKLQLPLHVKSFNTHDYAKEKGISIEMAARELRYEWFNGLAEEQNCKYIATGHHADDSIETFFLNLTRGTGIRGLTGIMPVSGNVIRPLLFASRHDVEHYCATHGIGYRTDSSNADTQFYRNRIRHEVIPALRKLNPSLQATMLQNMKRLRDLEALLDAEVERTRLEIVAEEDGKVLIPIRLLKEHPFQEAVVFELMRPFGFNQTVVANIIESLNGIPGRQFFSSTHRLIRDRYNLIVSPREESEDGLFFIEGEDSHIDFPFQASINVMERTPDYEFSKEPEVMHFDADLVDFPLTLRHWRDGDQFMPLGMNHFKKLSDFFIDEKFSLLQKESAWLILSGDDIIAIAGCRIDNRYKITSKTKTVLEISVKCY